jgi:hypothetical protein
MPDTLSIMGVKVFALNALFIVRQATCCQHAINIQG